MPTRAASRTTLPTSSAAAACNGSDDLERIGCYLGRAYYTYLSLLGRVIADMGVGDHVQPGMGNVLFALFEEDNRTITEIAERLRVSKSTMTGMVERIREAGLITTQRCTADGRAVRLKLTPLGRSLESSVQKVARRMDEVLCAELSEKEQGGVREALALMTESLTQEIQRLDGPEKRNSKSLKPVNGTPRPA